MRTQCHSQNNGGGVVPQPVGRALPARPTSRSGTVLIIVMWIAFGVISVALYFAHSMEMEMRATDTQVGCLQADQAIEAGAVYASNVLYGIISTNMLPLTNTYQCAAVKVGEARFWFIGRDTNDTGVARRSGDPVFGLVDEASKVNLNAILLNTNTATNLYSMPQMTQNLLAAIYDWQSTNTTPSQGGAKNETYSGLNPAYLCKLTNYETVGELRMVYGMNLDLLYGEDINLNGTMDPNENDGAALPPNDNQNGDLDPGFLEYLTVYTQEPSNIVNSMGSTNRVVVTNTTALTGFLSTNLSSSQSTTIMAKFTTTPPSSVLDFYNRSGMNESDFINIEPLLMNPNTKGLININTATATALACIPGIGYNNAPSVLTYRQGNPSRLNSIAWLKDALSSVGTNAITLAGPWVTSRSFQYTADIAAVGRFGRGYRRVRFIFDISSGLPQIIYRQDLTDLGWALGKKTHDQLLAGK